MRFKALLGLLALTLTTAVLVLTLLVGGAAGGHGKGKGHNKGSGSHGRIGYHFLVLDQIAGASDRLIIQSDGSFNRNRASGGEPSTTSWPVPGPWRRSLRPGPGRRRMLSAGRPARATAYSTEGVVVTIPGGPTFIPTDPTTGVTVFSLTKGHKH